MGGGPENKKSPPQEATGSKNNPGSDLLSHTVTRAVPSAVEGLTSVFGMGTGVTPLLWPPGNFESADRSIADRLIAIGCSHDSLFRCLGVGGVARQMPARSFDDGPRRFQRALRPFANGPYN